MNAFAVPGGVVGFHTGVFAFAENEDQMASVLAHELAHLSQRHFSRGTEAQKKELYDQYGRDCWPLWCSRPLPVATPPPPP